MPNTSNNNTKQGLIQVNISLLKIAEDACKRCIDKENRSDAITAVIFSVVALEAYINELGAQAAFFSASNERIQCFADLMKEFEDSQEKLKVKYKLAFFILSGNSCPMGSQPFQNFSSLIALRNCLIHYKAQMTTYDADSMDIIYKPSKLITELDKQGLIPQSNPNTDMPFMSRVGTAKVAIWAFNTAIKMIIKIRDIIPESDFRKAQLHTKIPDEINLTS